MKLPVGYKELEYIETSGTQVIDTGVFPNQDTSFELDIDILETNKTDHRHFFSANSTTAYFAHRITADFTGLATRYATGALQTIPGGKPYGRKKIVRNKNVLRVNDGEEVVSPTGKFSISYGIAIGGHCSSSGISQTSNVRIYPCNIKGNGTDLTRDFVPCQNESGKNGLYDLVSKAFFGNAIPGGSDFIAGPEITYPPGVISDLSASLDATSVLLTWVAGENSEGYKVYRDGLELGDASETQYLDMDAPYGSHLYEVSTTNRYGESERISITVLLEEPAPPPIAAAIPSDSTILYLLDKNYDAYDAVDKFKSLLWTVRYNKAGDFELYVPADLDIVKRFHEGDYVWIEDSDRLMILEDINLQTDPEDGDYLILSGRSLESILERRIIWGMTVITGNFQNGIKTLLNRNVISPAIENRRIPNFTFKESTDPRITELTVEAQYFGENLYEEIEKLCQEKEVGFKVLPNGAGGFEFSLYIGEDRSYDQIKNPWVVFAPNYENLQSSNYLYSKKNFKNATLVGGQGENWSRDTVEVTSDSSSGLDRRETFTDASGATNDTSGIENDDTLTEEEKQEAIAALTEEYNAQLMQKGKEELAKTSITETFDGEIDASLQYVYRQDFDLGDIVQIVNDYGMEASSRVSEIVISHDPTGKTVVPTFTVKTDEKGDEK